MTDHKLLEIYHLGFINELDGIDPIDYNSELENSAYKLGTIHAIIGDDIRSVDYLSNEEILRLIKQ